MVRPAGKKQGGTCVRDLIFLSREGRDLGVAFQAPPGSQASSRGEAKDSTHLSSRDAQRHELPSLETVQRESQHWIDLGGLPVKAGTPPQILLDGLRPLLAGTSGCLQLHHHSPSPAHSAAPTNTLQRRTEVNTSCLGASPSTRPGRTFKKVAPAPAICPQAGC